MKQDNNPLHLRPQTAEIVLLRPHAPAMVAAAEQREANLREASAAIFTPVASPKPARAKFVSLLLGLIQGFGAASAIAGDCSAQTVPESVAAAPVNQFEGPFRASRGRKSTDNRVQYRF